MGRRLQALLKTLFRRNTVEAELDEEVQDFYETQVGRYVGRGVPEQEARRLAHLNFGHPESVKEQVRDTRTGSTVVSILRDVSFAFRTMRKAPVYALVTVLTLALGIGANSTIFSIVSRFVLRPLPVGDPATLMALHTTQARECCNSFSWPVFNDLREQAQAFSGLTAWYDLFPASLAGNGEPERVWGQAVTANYFDVARLPLAVGRGFNANEENLALIVLGHALWQSRFAADRAIAGKTIRLSGRPFTVIGVAPPGFRGLDFILNSQFWVPLGNLGQLLPNLPNRTSRIHHWLAVAGRLKPGSTRTQAAGELDLLAQRFAAAHPESDKDIGFRFEPAGSLPPKDRTTLMMFLAGLSAVAILVLCIACANVANLSLAQAAGRRTEMAVRLALGATRGRLLRQMATESVLLALGGGLVGLILSLLATRGLGAFHFPAPVPLDLTIGLDSRVLLYAFVLSLGAGILFGLVAAWSASRPVIAGALRGEDMLARGGRIWTLRHALVMSQIAMSLVLLCTTGLFLRSLQNAWRIDIGFRTRGLLMMSVDPRLHGYTAERSTEFLNRLRDRVATIPGVISAACTDAVPLSGGHRSDGFQIEGQPNPQTANISVDMYMATAGYFQTMGIPRIAGRDLSGEGPDEPEVAIVNEAFVRRFFPQENALGQHVRDGGRIYRIVGVVANIKSRTLGEFVRPVLYRSLAQDIAADPSVTGYTVLVQYAGNSGTIENAVRREIHSLDPALAIFDEATMEEHVRDALFLPRLAGALFGVFGFIGLALAAVGLYGVMSYSVSRRTREIGIRLAVGAQASEVQRLIVRQGIVLTCVALAPGLAAAWALSRLFASFLYGVPAHDSATFIVVPLFLTAVAFLACWIPSRRAARLDPSITLRHN